MKVYISGPITGTTDYMERFAQIERRLMRSGYTVVNPAKVNANLPVDTTHAEYMEMSFTMLDMCDAILMMNGWQQSRGAGMEFDRAVRNGMTIAFEGGRECQNESQSKQKRENLLQKLVRRYFSETKPSAYSVR